MNVPETSVFAHAVLSEQNIEFYLIPNIKIQMQKNHSRQIVKDKTIYKRQNNKEFKKQYKVVTFVIWGKKTFMKSDIHKTLT